MLPEDFSAREAEPAPDVAPVLDAHIHLFDPTRPGGIPWPAPEDAVLYRPALPERFAALACRLGVRAAIAVEASPLRADNDWLLATAAGDRRIVGVVASLDPAAQDFPRELARLRAHPLLVGIRSGNLWGRDLARAVADARTLDHLRLLADSGLTLDVANPDCALLEAVVAVAERIPELRIVVDHLPAWDGLGNGHERCMALLAALGRCPGVYAKISEIPRRVGGSIPGDPEFYRPLLEQICAAVDEDHLIFGSDWPNSDRWLPYAETFALARGCMGGLSLRARRKFFWSNALAAYPGVRGRAGTQGEAGARGGSLVD